MFHSALTLSSVAVFYAVAGTRVDLLLNVALLAYFNRQALASHLHTTIVSVPILLLFCLGVTLAVLVMLASPSSHASTWQGPGQPYLIPCRTTHRRFSPKKHSFSYSYLTVGVPVGFNGSFNGMIGVYEKPSSPFRNTVSFMKPFFQSWYHIQASDYLQRGGDELGLRGKLNSYLQSEGVDPTDYPFAYFITAARFAGYNFNPVSLWYLYTAEKTLSAIVLEVNNIFDERRPYLLISDAKADPSHGIHGQRRQIIKGSRVKDFHVSPFNSRKGYYSVTANDPLGPKMNGFRGIDVTITLKKSNGHPKLVARLCSHGPAVSPMGLGPVSKLLFLAKWFWVGFATLPRIFWQAAVLLYLVKLRRRDKPEPLVETLGRHPTSVEETIKVCFGQYLEFLVCQSGKPISVKYYTSGLLSGTGRLLISSCGKDLPEHDILELRVLTPAFYSRVIQYCDSLDALFAELNNNRTIWVNKPELLPHIFGSPGVITQPEKLSDRLFASLLRHLRQRPPKINLPSPCRPLLAVEFNENFRCSMDAYMLSNKSEVLKTRYKRAAFHQLAADRYFRGQLALLTWMTTIVRILIAWACVTFSTGIIRVEY